MRSHSTPFPKQAAVKLQPLATWANCMGRRKKPNHPTTGAAFAFPLGDGRFAVCRVLLDTTSQGSKQWSTEPILVACSAWIGDELPTIDDPALRPILHLNHHLWDNKPNILWISEELPEDFIPLGHIEPTKEEQSIPCERFGNWHSLTLQPLAQWRWDKDRAAVLAEDAKKEKKDVERRQDERREREAYLDRITLGELRDHDFFGGWKDHPPANLIRASKRIMTRTVEQLLEVGSNAPEQGRMTILQQCIESFNQLDAESRFIETDEREDICNEFEALVHACGLGAHQDLADRWREW